MTSAADSARPHRRLAAVVVAVLCALLAAFVAPPDWAAGPATLDVRLDGQVVATVPVTLGSTTAVSRDVADDAGRTWTITLAGGAPLDAPLRVEVHTDAAGQLTPADVTLVLTPSDGADELVPVLRRRSDGVLEAVRRPPVNAALALALLGAVVILWVTEALPLWVTSLLVPVVIAGSGAATARTALAPFFDPIIALFFAGFLMAEAMRRAGLDRRLACTLVARAARGPGVLFAAFLALSAFLSMFMSNTASTALLLPIALAVTAPLGDVVYRKTVVLGLAYAATIGGVGSAIGTPANPIAMRFLSEHAGRPVPFAAWFAYGLPVVALLLPAMGVWVWRRAGVRVESAAFDAVRAAARADAARLPRTSAAEWTVAAVLAATTALWLTQSLHGLDNAVIALGAAVVLAATGRVRSDDLARIEWASLLTFGGGLALGLHLTEAGVADWIAARLGGLSGLPGWVGIGMVAAVTLALTTVASNTATAAMLVPLALPLSGVLGVDAAQLVVTVAVASSIDFALVIGTPPTLFAYSTRLFTAAEIFRTGIVVDLIGLVIVVALATLLW